MRTAMVVMRTTKAEVSATPSFVRAHPEPKGGAGRDAAVKPAISQCRSVLCDFREARIACPGLGSAYERAEKAADSRRPHEPAEGVIRLAPVILPPARQEIHRRDGLPTSSISE